MEATEFTIRKELELPVSAERAFRLFIHEIARWWPMASHSVGGDETVDVTVEGHVEGRFVETTRDGARHVWGTITVWRPPERVVTTWHPGRPADDATELELRFEASGSGCRLILEHRGWERVAWSGERDSYVRGWDPVLARYADVVAEARTASPIRPGPA